MIEPVIIGRATLYLGDCRDIPNAERITLRHPGGVLVETWPDNAEIYLFHGFILVMTGPLAMSA